MFFHHTEGKPLESWGGYLKSVRADIYADGRLVITNMTSGGVLECNIFDVATVTLSDGGFGKSCVHLNGDGYIIGITRPLPVKWARGLKEWLEAYKGLLS